MMETQTYVVDLTVNKRKPETPHKSTTHAERFYHFTTGPVRGTVFMRQEGVIEFGYPRNEDIGWAGCAAVLSEGDMFDRRRGRTIARRRYFLEGGFACSPTYESAEHVLRAYAKRYGKLA
jgi:hypothetical protein